MKKRIKNPLLSILSLLLACSAVHAYEQDNWYLANEWGVNQSKGVFYHEDNVTGIGQIYVCNGSTTSSRISVYDMNGSLDRHITIASTRYEAYDLVLDQNGTIYIAEQRAVTCLENDGTFKWRTGKNASISNYGSTGSGNGEFQNARGITIGQDGNLFVADYDNKRVQVLDKNGSFLKKFGSSGTAPGQLYKYTYDVKSLSDGTLVVRDYTGLNYFDLNGTFIKRLHPPSGALETGFLAISKSDEILTWANKTLAGIMIMIFLFTILKVNKLPVLRIIVMEYMKTGGAIASLMLVT